MELRQLRLFVAVAEERNFTRAAERCNLTQPSLTRQIQMLEDDLGVALFDRSKRQIELTEAGTVLLEEARRTLAQAEQTRRRLRDLRPEMTTLRLAVHYPEYAHRPPVAPLLAAFRQRFPTVRLDVSSGPATDLTRSLERGELDAGFLHVAARRTALPFEPLLREQVFVAFVPHHPLAALPEVPLAALGQTDMIIGDRSTFPEVYDHLLERCRAGGWVPRHVLSSQANLSAVTGRVLLEEGVLIVAGTVVDHMRALGLTCRRIQADLEQFDVAFGLVWHAEPNGALEDFLALAREQAHDRRAEGVP